MLTFIAPGIRRITIPYKDIYTSVFILDTEQGAILFDTAATDYDVETYILPALRNRNLQYIFISHHHRDHSGGLSRLMEVFPEATIVSQSVTLAEQYARFPVRAPEEGELLLDTFQVVKIPGHTADCQALLDIRNGILFTGDALQAYGIYGEGQWGACIRCIPDHLAALEKLRNLPITDLLLSHDYHPFGNEVYGSEDINRCLDSCAVALFRVREAVCRNPSLSNQEIADLYNRDSGLPTVPAYVPEAIRVAMGRNEF